MTLTLGLMGFGRVGRSIFRILQNRNDVRVAAISDIADPVGLEYLVRYDTILGPNPVSTHYDDGFMYAMGRQIPMLRGERPGEVAWKDYGVDIVIEATGKARNAIELKKHIEIGGASRVVSCVPTPDDDVPQIAMGINDHALKPSMDIVSNASMTAHCAAPIAEALDRAFGINRIFFTVIHAYSNDQKLGDVPTGGQLRLSRAAAENIVPIATNAGANLERILPELSGKVSALALKVPVDNGSAVDMVAFTEKEVSKDAVNHVIKSAIEQHYPRIAKFATDPIVSSDIRMSPHSSVFDSLATMTLGVHSVKTISWYDNGWGYAHRAIELATRLAELGEQA
ncbi:MAG: glyceraldehyde 3-phosphate dehydrogenase NAD-binding domain-containing protein [Myxococcota bacterium]